MTTDIPSGAELPQLSTVRATSARGADSLSSSPPALVTRQLDDLATLVRDCRAGAFAVRDSGPTPAVRAVAFSPTGNLLASSGSDGTVSVASGAAPIQPELAPTGEGLLRSELRAHRTIDRPVKPRTGPPQERRGGRVSVSTSGLGRNLESTPSATRARSDKTQRSA